MKRTCSHCSREIPASERRLSANGTIAWTAGPIDRASDAEVVLRGGRDAEFCSIRCLGTLIGVTLENRGLIPPKHG